MKYIPVIVCIFVLITVSVVLSVKQDKTAKTMAAIELNVPEIARSRIELMEQGQLVIMDGKGNIIIK